MELILLENILNLGNIGDKVKVKDGYGRNYLLKQGKALRFNKSDQAPTNTFPAEPIGAIGDDYYANPHQR